MNSCEYIDWDMAFVLKSMYSNECWFAAAGEVQSIFIFPNVCDFAPSWNYYCIEFYDTDLI